MPKITTEECRTAIAGYFAPKTVYQDLDPDLTNPKNWKRVNKKGNPKKGFIRVFRNTKVDGLMNVHSTTDKITKVERNVPITETPAADKAIQYQRGGNMVVMDVVSVGRRNTLRDGRTIQEVLDSDRYDGVYNLPFANLPRINSNMERESALRAIEESRAMGEEPDRWDLDAAGEMIELVDFENRKVEEIGPTFITITAGGDWQPATTWTARIGDNGLLYTDPSTIDYNGDNWARPSDGVLVGTRRW